ncbi:MAG: radical SAM family heme chaperone HemW [Salinicola sp.]|uniref:radical SAM family heme chaperone HemW n=1 Tax=Salinicola sp. TaxID=1978524 RepID=UPI001DF052FF|nr:radical SAM family heme chaperone HemW [Salinicola sp.]NRB55110.1 radical SAM family heme chaperone HemW [Salinicola sp.]
MRDLPPLALYIHVPWCVRKCPYCDFNSHGVGRGAELPESRYVDALLTDLEQDLVTVQGREIVSIFIGGGTPSLFSAAAYQRLFDGLRQRLVFAPDIEITLEANPGTVEQARFEGYRRAGINRLSIGVQSFAAEQLEALGRIHSGGEARRAMISAREAGFDNVNLDLMHGLPGQTPAAALGDIEQALALEPTHLSWYQLTLEPNTEFFSHPPPLPDEERLWDIQDAGHDLLESAGFSRYEISAYARPGRQARHNLNYWRFGDYLGIGAGAHGKLSSIDPAGRWRIERRWKTRQPEAYLRRMNDPRGFVAGSQPVDGPALPLEFLMNALRLTAGVDAEDWENHTGRPLSELTPRLEAARRKGLLTISPSRLQATPQGLLFLNDLLALFDEEA